MLGREKNNIYAIWFYLFLGSFLLGIVVMNMGSNLFLIEDGIFSAASVNRLKYIELDSGRFCIKTQDRRGAAYGSGFYNRARAAFCLWLCNMAGDTCGNDGYSIGDKIWDERIIAHFRWDVSTSAAFGSGRNYASWVVL